MLDLFNIADAKDIRMRLFIGENKPSMSNRRVGLVFFKDGSIGACVNVKGSYMPVQDPTDISESYKNFMEFFEKTILEKNQYEGAVYQYIYTPDFNYDDFEKDILSSNFFKTDEQSKDIYLEKINKKVDKIKKYIEDLKILLKNSEYYNNVEKSELKKELIKQKDEYENMLQNFISSSLSIEYLEKFFDALNMRTVELIRNKMRGRVRRHKYYLFIRFYPDYKSFNLNRNTVIEDLQANLFEEEQMISEETYQIVNSLISHYAQIIESLPFGGNIMSMDDIAHIMCRFLGISPHSFSGTDFISRQFPYPMSFDKDKIVIKNVPNSPVPAYDKHNNMINDKLKHNISDVVLTGHSITSLPDPGRVDLSLPIDFLANMTGDYSIVWSFYREPRKETRKKINANRRLFDIITDIPILGKKLFSPEAKELKRSLFEMVSLNAEMNFFGDLFKVATHVVLRKAVPLEEKKEAYIRYNSDNKRRINKTREIYKEWENNKQNESNIDFYIAENFEEYIEENFPDEISKKNFEKLIYSDDRNYSIHYSYFKKIGSGVTAIREKDNFPDIFLKSMFPLSFTGWRLLERYVSMYSISLAAYIPTYVEPEGMNAPGLILETGSGLYKHNHFALDIPKHYLIIGGTGSGKTFTEVNRLMNLFSQGARLIFVDRGGALFRAVKFLNGQNIKLRMTKDPSLIKYKLNPFVISPNDGSQKQIDYDEYLQSIRMFLVTLLCSIVGRNDHIAKRCFAQLIDEELIDSKGIQKNTVKAKDTGKETVQITFTDIYSYLNKKKIDGKQNGGNEWNSLLDDGQVLSAISNYTKNSLYGSLFDGVVEESFIHSPVAAIDFEGLESEEISEIALAIINTYLWNIVRGAGGFVPSLNKKYTQTDIAFDEVWSLLQTEMGRQVLKVGARTLRKHGAGMGMLTQSAADINNSPIRDDLVANMMHLYALKSTEGDIPNYEKAFGLKQYELDIIGSLTSKMGVYNEIYYKCFENTHKHYNGVLKLRPVPLTYAIVTSDKKDKEVIELYQNEFSDNGDNDNISYMKAVLLFSRLFPGGIATYPHYAELMAKKGNNIYEFAMEVAKEHSVDFRSFDLNKELMHMNISIEDIFNK